MKKRDKILTTLQGLTSTVKRYPVSIILFLCSAILTSCYINNNKLTNFSEFLISFLLGATIYMLLQMIYERFFSGTKIRLVFCAVAILAATIYYLVLVYVLKAFNPETVIRTMVIFFILIIGFIWIPSIKSKIGFSESFMAVFKAFFIVAFYAGVLYLGAALVLMATNNLIVEVDSKAYFHVGSIIAFIYAPIHFLSLIPIYPGFSENDNLDKVDGETDSDLEELKPSKFLNGLISYIVIPITTIFTAILLLYILLNITGDFWKDNLMEPLLVSYSITVITVYLLASVIDSKATKYFRMVFPKVLIPVVLFQTVSSILKIGELGITSGRYYVIMFGIFATISAVIFSIWPNKKNNIIAPILIILSIISILPPVDAFTISKGNQINRLHKVLIKNEMLEDDMIIPKADLSNEDKEIIRDTIRYLDDMDYIEDINWLQSYNETEDFEKTFGFYQYEWTIKKYETYNLYLPEKTGIDVSLYDFFIAANLDWNNQDTNLLAEPWGDKGYFLILENTKDNSDLVLMNNTEDELLRYSLNQIFAKIKDRQERSGILSPNEAEFRIENDNAIVSIITRNITWEIWEDREYKNINAYIMVKIK